MASEDPQMTKKGIAGKRQHGTSTIPEKLEIIRTLEGGKNQRGYGITQYLIVYL